MLTIKEYITLNNSCYIKLLEATLLNLYYVHFL